MSDLLPYGTAIGSVVAFLFAAWQYIDTRRQENRNQRFEQFHRVFEWVVGRTPEGKPLVDTQQALAIYELGEFPEYRDVSLPIINHYIRTTEGEPNDTLFRGALRAAKARLEAATS